MRISQDYGRRNDGSFHYGIDFAVPVGTKVNVIGTVIKRGVDDVKGIHLISERDGWVYHYLHLSDSSHDDYVITGNTGNSTGPHLHFEVSKVIGCGFSGFVPPGHRRADVFEIDELTEQKKRKKVTDMIIISTTTGKHYSYKIGNGGLHALNEPQYNQVKFWESFEDRPFNNKEDLAQFLCGIQFDNWERCVLQAERMF